MATSLQCHEQSEPQIQHQQRQVESSPPTSATSSPKSVARRRSASPLSLDLSNLPALSQPSPPSNTLLITQLNDPTIFHPASLATIRQHINSLAPLHSFSPLKSFRRIVCSFYDTESAIQIRQHLDGASLLGNVRTRVYFGEPTPIGEQKKYLDRPDAGRLFFISPPPSPPVGWEVRDEDPPNKHVVASDLAEALVKLSGKLHSGDADAAAYETPLHQDDEKAGNTKPPLRATAPPSSTETPASTSTSKHSPAAGGASSAKNRSRSSTILYDPETHGDSPALPAVMVEDTTMDDDMDVDDDNDEEADNEAVKQQKTILAHTSRPPVELMAHA